jgi:hypothetical protein
MDFAFAATGFVADAIIDHLRSGNYPTDSEAIFLDRRPLIDGLRQRINENDIPRLLNIVRVESGPRAGLACSLLRNFVQQDQVKSCFEARWASATAFLKNRLMWRLLDIPELPQAWHRRFFDFILNEWSTFRDFNLVFYGGSQQALGSILSRMMDQSFPDSKKWIYPCSAIGVVEDQGAVRALVHLGRSMNDPFAREVADALLQRFFPDEGHNGAECGATPGREAALDLCFVADAIISYLRKGNLPTEEEADYLNRLPIIDELRGRIGEGDQQWVFEIVERESGEVGGLYLSLLRRLDSQANVQLRLHKRWEVADAFLKAHLMWRILDDPYLPPEWHEKLFDFVLKEWDTFNKVSLKFLGDSQTVVLQALKRIGDSTFPDTKKWAYLCRVPQAAEDKEAARALVTLGLSMSDKFTQQVAEVLLKRFF